MVKIAYNYQDHPACTPRNHDTIRMGMTPYAKLAALEKIPLFNGLTEKQRDWLRARLYPRSFPGNTEIMVSGMPGDSLYIVLSGTVKVYAPQPDGEEVIIAIMGPGDPVGEMSTIDDGGHSASVVTLEDTEVMWMSRENFTEALGSMPVLSQNLMRILSERLRRSTDQIQALASMDVNRRVIRQLLVFADRYSEPGSDGYVVIPIRLTQNDLAGLVGASRKRVNQAIVGLKRQNLISIDGGYHITIENRDALNAFLESPDL